MPSNVPDNRKIVFVAESDPRLGVMRYSATLPEGLQPGDSFKTRVPVRPKLSLDRPPPACRFGSVLGLGLGLGLAF